MKRNEGRSKGGKIYRKEHVRVDIWKGRWEVMRDGRHMESKGSGDGREMQGE